MTTKEPLKKPFTNVIVHPLVLLSVVDHFNRLRKSASSQKRVVGVLLGSSSNGELDISNSFAVPFEEDAKDKKVWFLDHDYLENMFAMFKKVNARERIVGWYHSGPKLHSNDIVINELLRKYNPNSVLVVVDVSLKDADALPTEAYISVEEINDDGSPTMKTFEHLNSEIGAETSEEVGVEHLLRDIKDTSAGTLMQSVLGKINGLNGLVSQLDSIVKYMDLVIEGKIPVNHKIIYLLQDIFNLLPDVKLQEMVRCIHINTNDHSLVIFIASMIRSILALHDLVSNKLTNRDLEKGDGFSERKFESEAKPVEAETQKSRK